MLVYLICYGAGMLSASSAHYCLSGAFLILAAVYLYGYDYRRTKNPLHLRGLFSAFWVGGQGISCMKLSWLQTDWEPLTWACFFLALVVFWCVFGLAERRFGPAEQKMDMTGYGQGLFLTILMLTAVSLGAFLLEAAVLGYVPFFVRGVPHAYSYFHISGVHYFTVSCVLVPPMAVVLFVTDNNLCRIRKIAAAGAAGIALLIPILCVSRFQLIFSVILSVITFMQVSGIKKIRYLVCATAALIPLYVILTIARSHDVEYLNGIFEMRNGNTPIFITQPYMYIANNYDNFNCLVRDLPAHTLGVKSLFPLWALTGLKFIKPELAAFPLYVTKEELTTVTLFYDAYYDFGIAGVAVFSAVLGLFSAWLMKRASGGGNPFWHVFYGQAALYLMLSFFTTWYSNPTTWFYFAVTGASAVFVEIIRRTKNRKIITKKQMNNKRHIMEVTAMVSEKMKPFMANNSAIRAMFEEGKRMAAIYGEENVYDFSLGNPNVPVPGVNEALLDVINNGEFNKVHGYMSNAGYEDVRQTIADSLNRLHGTSFTYNNLIMTVGAASGLNVILKSIINPGDEVIVFAPYFVEYNGYVRNYDGNVVVISPDTETFMPKLSEFEAKITEKTKAVIINSPNNPTGVVYSEETLMAMAAIMKKKEEEYHTSIVLISDEPYRELAYGGVEVPYVTKYYHNTVVCYSYSKSLSVPGERIGYLVIPDEVEDSETLIGAATIANRVLGCVNAPSLIQRAIKYCIEHDITVDLEAYERNRNLLYNALIEDGFTCAKPDGAFYLFVKSPVADEKEFCETAKKHHVLFVPGSSFACPGYVRIAYCVSYEQIERSLPAFRAIAEEYGLTR